MQPSDDGVRATVRNVLRHGGYKPTGRSKPASSIFFALRAKACLVRSTSPSMRATFVSLHSGLPISVVGLDRAREPLRVGVAAKGTTYVFNASGQVIDASGLLCLFDADGACANAVRDAQRTKTDALTRRTLSIVWGDFPRNAARAGHQLVS